MPQMDIESHKGGPGARAARDGDGPALVALWTAAGLTRPWNDPAADIAFARGGPASDVLVIERDGRIAASVMVGHDGHRGAVYYVAVDPALRGLGLGRAIMEAAEQWLRARGVWKLNLMVRTGNEGAMGFYAGLGYAQDEVAVMSKRLGGS
ncbi:GNAT family acetyltransferase [Parvibaculum sp.]|uniref:GNAT family acetyltransferase n=1 Tax=Parvibaculum sp. TaxID=2024848 RepID=UPI0034A0A7EC